MEQIPSIMDEEVETSLGKSKRLIVAEPDLIENETLKKISKMSLKSY